MASWGVGVILLTLIAGSANATPRFGRTLTQTTPKVYQGTPSSVTVSAANPNINAITITPIIPYPQNAYFCNVTGDSRIPQQGPFPLTVYVPVGVTSTVIFANVTGPIPGTSCTGANVVQQQSTPGVVQQQTPSSVVQQQQTPSSVVQQQTPSSVVQQQTPSSVVQQQTPSSVVQQQTPSSVVQQQTPSSVVQQQTPSSVVQQQTPSSVVQQQGPSSSVVQQYASINQQNPNASQFLNCVGNTSSVVQQGPTPSVVQQPSPPSPPSSVVQQQQSSSVVQQPSPPTAPSSVVQQQQSSSVVQQKSPPSSVTQSSAVTQSSGSGSASASASASGRHLLQVGTIEYISNNGSSGQPQLTVLDTVEGVPRISFAPTDPSQTAVFNGALQVAVTTTNDGFGQPYIPYQVDSKLSPQCNVQVIFKAVAASAAPSSG